jgi:hypothetical protein
MVIRDNQILLSGMESYDVPSCETLINVNFCAVSGRAAARTLEIARAIWLATVSYQREEELLLEKERNGREQKEPLPHSQLYVVHISLSRTARGHA